MNQISIRLPDFLQETQHNFRPPHGSRVQDLPQPGLVAAQGLEELFASNCLMQGEPAVCPNSTFKIAEQSRRVIGRAGD